MLYNNYNRIEPFLFFNSHVTYQAYKAFNRVGCLGSGFAHLLPDVSGSGVRFTPTTALRCASNLNKLMVHFI